jgi:uncharacterized membrane protein YbhN (UPF0104 family)
MAMAGRAKYVRIAGLAVVSVAALLTLRSKLPDASEVGAAFSHARSWFIVLAAAAEFVSMRHFALQQRRLLAGYGVGMSIPRALAVTYSRSAIAISLPAGSAISAAFAFREFRTAGATRRAAGGVTVLSGLLSGAALVLMYGAAMLLPGTSVAHGPTVLLVLSTMAVALLVFLVDWRLSRTVYVPVDGADDDGRGPIALLRQTVANLRALPPNSWSLSLLHAAINWATDFACLAAVAAAFDLNVSVTRLATVYLTVQLVRQIPLTPGGVGIIEVALLAALVSAGGAQGAAAAVVLVYRVISCWMIIPIGGFAYALLRRQHQAGALEEPSMAVMDTDLVRAST